MMLINRR